MKFYPYLAVIFSCMFFTACKKSDSDNNTTTNPSKLLRQFKLVTGTDTTNKCRYVYDNNNRIQTASAIVLGNGTTSYDVDVTHSFIYNGDDSMPSSKRIDYHKTDGSTNTGYEFFQYDASGRMILDSVDQDADEHYTVYRYAYFPDHILLSRNAVDTLSSRITLQNGNIISEMDTIYSTVIFSSVTKVEMQLGYDNHINPLYRTSVRRPVINVFELYVDHPFVTQPSNNNILQYNIAERGAITNETRNVNISYTYDADGYPLTMTYTTGGITSTGYYYY